MTKTAESFEAVYIYIYIVSFNKIKLCEHREKAMCFRRTLSSFITHSFFRWEPVLK